MRNPFLVCLLLAACAPSVETTAAPRACVTSFGCPTGERCDDGSCVPDETCPGPLTSEVVYEQMGGDLQSGLVLLNGQEHWEGPLDLTPDSAGTATWLINLATKVRSTFPHPLGWGSCGGDPVRCTAYPADGSATTLSTSVHLDTATQTWTPTASFALPDGFNTFAADQPATGQWLLWSPAQKVLASWTPGAGAPVDLLHFGTESLLGVVEAKGLPKSILAQHNGPGTATMSRAPLAEGAAFKTFFSLEGGFKSAMVAVPRGDGGWFVVHDLPGGGTGFKVWRVDATGQTEVGTSEDRLVFLVAATYRMGSPALEGGSRGKAVVCEGDTCRSASLDLATLGKTAIGSATLPGTTNLQGAGTRWLACDTAEVLVTEILGDDGGTATGMRVWRARIPANGTP